LLHSCAKVRELIELSFEMVSGVGGEMAVLDGGSMCAKESGSFGGLSSQLLWGRE